jgi:hypothetical protein
MTHACRNTTAAVDERDVFIESDAGPGISYEQTRLLAVGCQAAVSLRANS